MSGVILKYRESDFGHIQRDNRGVETNAKYIPKSVKRRGKQVNVWKYKPLKTLRKNALFGIEPDYMLTFNFCDKMDANYFSEKQCLTYHDQVSGLFDNLQMLKKDHGYDDLSYLACLEGGWFKTHVIPFHYHIMISGIDEEFLSILRGHYDAKVLHFTNKIETRWDQKRVIDYIIKTHNKYGQRVKVINVPSAWKSKKFLPHQTKHNLNTSNNFDNSNLIEIDSSDLKCPYNVIFNNDLEGFDLTSEKNRHIYNDNLKSGRAYRIDPVKSKYEVELPEDDIFQLFG